MEAKAVVDRHNHRVYLDAAEYDRLRRIEKLAGELASALLAEDEKPRAVDQIPHAIWSVFVIKARSLKVEIEKA